MFNHDLILKVCCCLWCFCVHFHHVLVYRLGFCVKRHIDIETFTPQPYWLLDLGILKRGRMIRAQWDSGRSFNQNKVQKLLTTCFGGGESDSSTTTVNTAKVTSVVAKDKKQGRPTPLNTVALLKACSKALGIGPHHTMHVAESLYLSGYLSYPRTESSAYPKSFDIRDTLRQQAQDSRWSKYVTELLNTGHTKPRGGVDMVRNTADVWMMIFIIFQLLFECRIFICFILLYF